MHICKNVAKNFHSAQKIIMIKLVFFNKIRMEAGTLQDIDRSFYSADSVL